MPKSRSFPLVLFTILLTVLFLLLGCNFIPSDRKEGEENGDLDATMKALELQITMQAQQILLTSQAQTLAAPAQPPLLPVQTEPPQMPTPQLPPPQITPMQPPPGNNPSARILIDTPCYFTLSITGGEVTNFTAGQMVEILSVGEGEINWLRVIPPDRSECYCFIQKEVAEIVGDTSTLKPLDGYIVSNCQP